ncbi:MAG: TolC family protein [Bryobacteraceae bacterium]
MLCSLHLAAGQTPEVAAERTTGFSRITQPYKMQPVAPLHLGNSNRIESLLRAGILYLSLQDTIALALENNLDIELQRWSAQIADANILRAKSGGLLRGVPPSVQQGPTGAPSQRGQDTGITGSAASQVRDAGGAGTIISQTGSVIPNLDPGITGFLRWGHFTNPQTSAFVSGTNTLVNRSDLTNFSIQQGFLTGTTVTLGLSNSHLSSTSLRSELNPSTNSSLNLQITQKLLEGFGVATNSRNIRVAKNNREVSDLLFKQQVITTVSAIINLYWDLVSFNEDVKVRQQALDLNRKLLDDNKKQVEIGTLAPIEIVRAEAEVANAEQDMTLAQTRVLQQETILKNALSRTGVASPAIADARIIPTDRIRVPEKERIEPVQDMIATALSARPEIAQRRIQLENDKISLQGSKSQLRPQLDAIVTVANNALAGQVSDLPLPALSGPRVVPGFFVGGYGTVLSQLFARNFPDYSLGFSLNIPLRNRSAQADMAIDQLNVRQREIALQQTENSIRVDVHNALIAVQQSRAAYQASVKTRVFREQTLDAEQKKYALGASTIFNVILVQRDLAAAQSAEVATLSSYSKARVQLDMSTGQTLGSNNISIEEAFRGRVARPAAALP